MNLTDKIKTSQYCGLPHTVYILALGKMINCIGAFINPLLSLILIQKIGLSVKEAGFIVSLALICQGPFIMLGGKLVDTIGPKKVIVTFQSIAGIIFITCGFLPTSHFLIYLLVFQSCCSALTTSSFDAIIGNITDVHNRKASFSLIYMGLNLGYAIGPALGALLFNNYLSLLFIGDGLTTLICAMIIAKFISESEYNNTEIERTSLEEGVDISVFAVLKQRPAIPLFAFTTFLSFFVYAQFNFTLPIQLGEVIGTDESPAFFGLLCSLNGFIVITCTPIVTSLTKRYTTTNVMAIGALAYAIFLTSCGFASEKWLFIIIIILVTLAEISLSINTGPFIASLTPSSHRGRILSIIPIVTSLGHSLSSSIMGLLISGYGLKTSWVIVGCVGIISAAITFSLKYIPQKQ